MNKVALYCRVSTSEQTNENQKIRLLKYASDNDVAFDMFEETESSRKTRPVKADLLNRLRNKEYESVIVYKLDRFARSSAELILDISELVKKKIGFISISENLDFTTASGKLHFQILSAFAEFERELIRERTIEGLKRAKLQGKSLGRPLGSKDGMKRKKSGYILRGALKKQKASQANGEYKSIEEFLQ